MTNYSLTKRLILTTGSQAMLSLFGDESDGFGNDSVFWYDCMSELVANNNGWVLTDTGGVI